MNNSIYLFVDLGTYNLCALRGEAKKYIQEIIHKEYDIAIPEKDFMLCSITPIITVSEQEITESGRKGNIHIRDALSVKVQITKPTT